MEFEEFYNAYYAKARSYTYKKIQNRSEADDVVCAAFLYCYEHFSQFDPAKASAGTWFYLILNSRIKNYYRDRKQSVSIDDAGDFLGACETDMEKAVMLEELRRDLAKALKALPEAQRLVVICRYFKNMDTAATAAEVGLTEGNVRVQLSRALKRLGQDMPQWNTAGE